MLLRIGEQQDPWVACIYSGRACIVPRWVEGGCTSPQLTILSLVISLMYPSSFSCGGTTFHHHPFALGDACEPAQTAARANQGSGLARPTTMSHANEIPETQLVDREHGIDPYVECVLDYSSWDLKELFCQETHTGAAYSYFRYVRCYGICRFDGKI